jgi:hypothetical protein
MAVTVKELDDDSPKVGLEDGDSEQENRDKTLTAQQGDDEQGLGGAGCEQ